jgi:hypothetical protein
MGYEDSVYLAKLAEQAERYEGKYSTNYSTVSLILMQRRNGGEHEDGRLR